MHFKHKLMYNFLRATVFLPFQLKAISRLPYVLALHFKLDGSIIDILFWYCIEPQQLNRCIKLFVIKRTVGLENCTHFLVDLFFLWPKNLVSHHSSRIRHIHLLYLCKTLNEKTLIDQILSEYWSVDLYAIYCNVLWSAFP